MTYIALASDVLWKLTNMFSSSLTSKLKMWWFQRSLVCSQLLMPKATPCLWRQGTSPTPCITPNWWVMTNLWTSNLENRMMIVPVNRSRINTGQIGKPAYIHQRQYRSFDITSKYFWLDLLFIFFYNLFFM